MPCPNCMAKITNEEKIRENWDMYRVYGTDQQFFSKDVGVVAGMVVSFFLSLRLNLVVAQPLRDRCSL